MQIAPDLWAGYGPYWTMPPALMASAVNRIAPWIEAQKGEAFTTALIGGTVVAILMIAAAWKITPWLEAQKGESGWAADN